jgi:hypothetical protein
MQATPVSATTSNDDRPIIRRPLLCLALGLSVGLLLFLGWLAAMALSG